MSGVAGGLFFILIALPMVSSRYRGLIDRDAETSARAAMAEARVIHMMAVTMAILGGVVIYAQFAPQTGAWRPLFVVVGSLIPASWLVLLTSYLFNRPRFVVTRRHRQEPGRIGLPGSRSAADGRRTTGAAIAEAPVQTGSTRPTGPPDRTLSHVRFAHMGWWVAKPQFRAGESVLWTRGANREQDPIRQVGGHLYLTDQRMVFQAHRFDTARGGDSWQIDLHNIASIEEEPRQSADAALPTAAGLRRRLRIVLRDGTVELFVINRLTASIKVLRAQLARHTAA
jgi:hypothetical protein